MIGYHYTSEANWQVIRREGLRPYVLRRDIVGDGVPGIWLWQERQRDRSHAGCVLFQIISKKTLSVVELAVAYDPVMTQRLGWPETHVIHEGKLTNNAGELVAYYHTAAKAVIAWHAIAPEQIELLARYHFDQGWMQIGEPIALRTLERAAVKKVTR